MVKINKILPSASLCAAAKFCGERCVPACDAAFVCVGASCLKEVTRVVAGDVRQSCATNAVSQIFCLDTATINRCCVDNFCRVALKCLPIAWLLHASRMVRQVKEDWFVFFSCCR
jgi:hypothetical protein